MGLLVDSNNEEVLIDLERCTGCCNCQLICSLTYSKTFNPSQARILISQMPGEAISFTEDCTECNLCVKYCVYGTLKLKEEVN